MRAARVAATAGWLVVAGCASVDERRGEAIAAVRGDVALRTSASAPTSAEVDAELVGAALDELLAAPLTEAVAVKVALLNNRDVRAAYERLGIRAAELVQAGLVHNPVFHFEAFFESGRWTELDMGLSQSFVDLFRRPLRVRVAEHRLAAAQAELSHELVHLVHEVRREFVRARAAARLVDLHRDAAAAATASHELMRTLFDAGNVTPPQLSVERIGEVQAKLDLAAAERAERESREPLHRLMGLWGEGLAWRVEGALDGDVAAGLAVDELEERAVAASLDLQQNAAQADAAAANADLEEWRGLLQEGALGVVAMRDRGESWEFGPSLEIALPVFDRGDAAVAAAVGELRALLHRRVQIGVEVRSAARLLRLRLAALVERAATIGDELLPAHRKLLDETVQNYNAMQIGVFDVLAQKQRQLAAKRERLATLRDAWLTRIDIEELAAGSMPASAAGSFWPGAGSAPAAGDRGGH